MPAKHTFPRKERKIARKVGIRQVKQSFLIVCEGLNTEPDYFNAFRLSSARVKAVGKGLGTISLVKEALSIRKEEERRGKSYDHYWLVFDKDDFPDEDFNEAIRLAEVSGFHAAWSNQSFEYWFILHFILFRGPLHRNQYADMLGKLIGIPYSKKRGAAKTLYNLLFQRLETAIANAKNVLADFSGVSPAKAESATTVFQLVEKLKEFMA